MILWIGREHKYAPEMSGSGRPLGYGRTRHLFRYVIRDDNDSALFFTRWSPVDALAKSQAVTHARAMIDTPGNPYEDWADGESRAV